MLLKVLIYPSYPSLPCLPSFHSFIVLRVKDDKTTELNLLSHLYPDLLLLAGDVQL